MLTPLQRRVAEAFFSLPEAEGFVLAGGAAAIIRAEVDRATRDLDFFAEARGVVRPAADRLVQRLRADGLECEVDRSFADFARLVVRDGSGEQIGVDLAWDQRWRKVEPSEVGPVLSSEWQELWDQLVARAGAGSSATVVLSGGARPSWSATWMRPIAAMTTPWSRSCAATWSWPASRPSSPWPATPGSVRVGWASPWPSSSVDLAQREAIRVPWRDLQRALRRLEDRGLVRGGRFVAGISGEQFALPAAAEQLDRLRPQAPTGERVVVNATDPLNLVGTLVPGATVPAIRTREVVYVDGVPA